MSKSSRNLGAVLAVLFLALLVAGLVFVVKVAYYDEPKMMESYVEASEASAPSTSETEEEIKETRIRLFETSDIHGYIVDMTGGDINNIEYRLAYIAGIINDARNSDEYDDVILVDGGDIYQGAPVSNLTEGAALRAALDLMDYDAVTVGNHEFDWDFTKYGADTMATVPAYEIGEFKGDPDIPVIAATLCSSNNHSRILETKDYVMVDKAGYRIALIGYIPDYSDKIQPSKIAPYELHSDLGEFSERVKKINEAEHPDVTVVVAHEMPLTVANALSHDDVDIVCGGHVHDGIYGVSDSGIPYIQANNNAQGYASATIVIDKDGNVTVEEPLYTSITEDPGVLYDTMANSGNFDPDILKLSHAAWDSISEEMGEALGYIDTTVERKGYISGPTTTGGNFITGLMLEYCKDEGAVAAFYNEGGICKDFTVAEGEILELTVADIYALNPFNNKWLIYDLTGEELAQQLVNGFLQSQYGDQVSGLKYEYKNHGTIDAPDIEIISITLDDGTKVDVHGTETKYRVVTSDFNASIPGSVFEGKTPLHPEVEAPVDNQALIELLRGRRDKGQVHIPTDTSPRGTCLNADEVAAASAAEGGSTTETSETAGTSETTVENTAETTAQAA